MNPNILQFAIILPTMEEKDDFELPIPFERNAWSRPKARRLRDLLGLKLTTNDLIAQDLITRVLTKKNSEFKSFQRSVTQCPAQGPIDTKVWPGLFLSKDIHYSMKTVSFKGRDSWSSIVRNAVYGELA